MAEVPKHDTEVVVYTAAELILTGNARRNKLVGAVSGKYTLHNCAVPAAEIE